MGFEQAFSGTVPTRRSQKGSLVEIYTASLVRPHLSILGMRRALENKYGHGREWEIDILRHRKYISETVEVSILHSDVTSR